MNKKILLVLGIIFSVNHALADGQSYGPIIQRQSKQIQELKSRILELENAIEEIRINTKKSAVITKQSTRASVVAPGTVIDEADEAILIPDEHNTFFGNKEVASTGQKDKSDYDLALAALKDGNFDDAEKLFADFIKEHPSSSLQSNATFWYSETFYRRGIFDKAAINYLQSYKNYPKGSKAPDALLKLAYSLASLNKNKEACSMLEKLDLEFPQRPISSIKRTKEAKNKFHCNNFN